MFKTSGLYLENLNETADIVINQGGTQSGKTYSLMQVLSSIAVSEYDKVITVVGQDIPNLRAGALRDMQTVVRSSIELQSLISGYNATTLTYTFNSGSIMEFKSYGNAQDAHSGKRDYLFINEAPGVSWQICEQLIDRTRTRVYIDYNPSAEFWVHDKLINSKYGDKSTRLIISDHRHNPFLSQQQHDHIEAKAKQDSAWGRVYARGLTGKIEGLIFSRWSVVDSIPKDATFVGRGLDFGFTNDQTAVVEVYKQDGKLWINEVLYERGLTNTDIDKRLTSLGVSKSENLIPDSAEPKSIEELTRLGWYCTGALKGSDSVKNSIDTLQRYELCITKNSANLRREIGKYKWIVDRNGRTLNEPVDFDNHAIDALRYVALNKLRHAGGHIEMR